MTRSDHPPPDSWGNIKVSFELSRSAAKRLHELAVAGDRRLKDIGILKVQIRELKEIALDESSINKNENQKREATQTHEITEENENTENQRKNHYEDSEIYESAPNQEHYMNDEWQEDYAKDSTWLPNKSVSHTPNRRQPKATKKASAQKSYKRSKSETKIIGISRGVETDDNEPVDTYSLEPVSAWVLENSICVSIRRNGRSDVACQTGFGQAKPNKMQNYTDNELATIKDHRYQVLDSNDIQSNPADYDMNQREQIIRNQQCSSESIRILESLANSLVMADEGNQSNDIDPDEMAMYPSLYQKLGRDLDDWDTNPDTILSESYRESVINNLQQNEQLIFNDSNNSMRPQQYDNPPDYRRRPATVISHSSVNMPGNQQYGMEINRNMIRVQQNYVRMSRYPPEMNRPQYMPFNPQVHPMQRNFENQRPQRHAIPPLMSDRFDTARPRHMAQEYGQNLQAPRSSVGMAQAYGRDMAQVANSSVGMAQDYGHEMTQVARSSVAMGQDYGRDLAQVARSSAAMPPDYGREMVRNARESAGISPTDRSFTAKLRQLVHKKSSEDDSIESFDAGKNSPMNEHLSHSSVFNKDMRQSSPNPFYSPVLNKNMSSNGTDFDNRHLPHPASSAYITTSSQQGMHPGNLPPGSNNSMMQHIDPVSRIENQHIYSPTDIDPFFMKDNMQMTSPSPPFPVRPKRKRGRQPHAQERAGENLLRGYPDDYLDSFMDRDQSNASTVVVKRRRGRPPKSASILNLDDAAGGVGHQPSSTAATLQEQPKRKRGRPPKNKAAAEVMEAAKLEQDQKALDSTKGNAMTETSGKQQSQSSDSAFQVIQCSLTEQKSLKNADAGLDIADKPLEKEEDKPSSLNSPIYRTNDLMKNADQPMQNADDISTSFKEPTAQYHEKLHTANQSSPTTVDASNSPKEPVISADDQGNNTDKAIQNADATPISVSKPTTTAADELMADQLKPRNDATADVTSICLDTPGIRTEDKLTSVDDPVHKDTSTFAEMPTIRAKKAAIRAQEIKSADQPVENADPISTNVKKPAYRARDIKLTDSRSASPMDRILDGNSEKKLRTRTNRRYLKDTIHLDIKESYDRMFPSVACETSEIIPEDVYYGENYPIIFADDKNVVMKFVDMSLAFKQAMKVAAIRKTKPADSIKPDVSFVNVDMKQKPSLQASEPNSLSNKLLNVPHRPPNNQQILIEASQKLAKHCERHRKKPYSKQNPDKKYVKKRKDDSTISDASKDTKEPADNLGAGKDKVGEIIDVEAKPSHIMSLRPRRTVNLGDGYVSSSSESVEEEDTGSVYESESSDSEPLNKFKTGPVRKIDANRAALSMSNMGSDKDNVMEGGRYSALGKDKLGFIPQHQISAYSSTLGLPSENLATGHLSSASQVDQPTNDPSGFGSERRIQIAKFSSQRVYLDDDNETPDYVQHVSKSLQMAMDLTEKQLDDTSESNVSGFARDTESVKSICAVKGTFVLATGSIGDSTGVDYGSAKIKKEALDSVGNTIDTNNTGIEASVDGNNGLRLPGSNESNNASKRRDAAPRKTKSAKIFYPSLYLDTDRKEVRKKSFADNSENLSVVTKESDFDCFKPVTDNAAGVRRRLRSQQPDPKARGITHSLKISISNQSHDGERRLRRSTTKDSGLTRGVIVPNNRNNSDENNLKRQGFDKKGLNLLEDGKGEMEVEDIQVYELESSTESKAKPNSKQRTIGNVIDRIYQNQSKRREAQIPSKPELALSENVETVNLVDMNVDGNFPKRAEVSEAAQVNNKVLVIAVDTSVMQKLIARDKPEILEDCNSTGNKTVDAVNLDVVREGDVRKESDIPEGPTSDGIPIKGNNNKEKKVDVAEVTESCNNPVKSIDAEVNQNANANKKPHLPETNLVDSDIPVKEVKTNVTANINGKERPIVPEVARSLNEEAVNPVNVDLVTQVDAKSKPDEPDSSQKDTITTVFPVRINVVENVGSSLKPDLPFVKEPVIKETDNRVEGIVAVQDDIKGKPDEPELSQGDDTVKTTAVNMVNVGEAHKLDTTAKPITLNLPLSDIEEPVKPLDKLPSPTVVISEEPKLPSLSVNSCHVVVDRADIKLLPNLDKTRKPKLPKEPEPDEKAMVDAVIMKEVCSKSNVEKITEEDELTLPRVPQADSQETVNAVNFQTIQESDIKDKSGKTEKPQTNCQAQLIDEVATLLVSTQGQPSKPETPESQNGKTAISVIQGPRVTEKDDDNEDSKYAATDIIAVPKAVINDESIIPEKSPTYDEKTVIPVTPRPLTIKEDEKSEGFPTAEDVSMKTAVDVIVSPKVSSKEKPSKLDMARILNEEAVIAVEQRTANSKFLDKPVIKGEPVLPKQTETNSEKIVLQVTKRPAVARHTSVIKDKPVEPETHEGRNEDTVIPVTQHSDSTFITELKPKPELPATKVSQSENQKPSLEPPAKEGSFVSNFIKRSIKVISNTLSSKKAKDTKESGLPKIPLTDSVKTVKEATVNTKGKDTKNTDTTLNSPKATGGDSGRGSLERVTKNTATKLEKGIRQHDQSSEKTKQHVETTRPSQSQSSMNSKNDQAQSSIQSRLHQADSSMQVKHHQPQPKTEVSRLKVQSNIGIRTKHLQSKTFGTKVFDKSRHHPYRHPSHLNIRSTNYREPVIGNEAPVNLNRSLIRPAASHGLIRPAVLVKKPVSPYISRMSSPGKLTVGSKSPSKKSGVSKSFDSEFLDEDDDDIMEADEAPEITESNVFDRMSDSGKHVKSDHAVGTSSSAKRGSYSNNIIQYSDHVDYTISNDNDKNKGVIERRRSIDSNRDGHLQADKAPEMIGQASAEGTVKSIPGRGIDSQSASCSAVSNKEHSYQKPADETIAVSASSEGGINSDTARRITISNEEHSYHKPTGARVTTPIKNTRNTTEIDAAKGLLGLFTTEPNTAAVRDEEVEANVRAVDVTESRNVNSQKETSFGVEDTRNRNLKLDIAHDQNTNVEMTDVKELTSVKPSNEASFGAADIKNKNVSTTHGQSIKNRDSNNDMSTAAFEEQKSNVHDGPFITKQLPDADKEVAGSSQSIAKVAVISSSAESSASKSLEFSSGSRFHQDSNNRKGEKVATSQDKVVDTEKKPDVPKLPQPGMNLTIVPVDEVNVSNAGPKEKSSVAEVPETESKTNVISVEMKEKPVVDGQEVISSFFNTVIERKDTHERLFGAKTGIVHNTGSDNSSVDNKLIVEGGSKTQETSKAESSRVDKKRKLDSDESCCTKLDANANISLVGEVFEISSVAKKLKVNENSVEAEKIVFEDRRDILMESQEIVEDKPLETIRDEKTSVEEIDSNREEKQTEISMKEHSTNQEGNYMEVESKQITKENSSLKDETANNEQINNENESPSTVEDKEEKMSVEKKDSTKKEHGEMREENNLTENDTGGEKSVDETDGAKVVINAKEGMTAKGKQGTMSERSIKGEENTNDEATAENSEIAKEQLSISKEIVDKEKEFSEGEVVAGREQGTKEEENIAMKCESPKLQSSMKEENIESEETSLKDDMCLEEGKVTSEEPSSKEGEKAEENKISKGGFHTMQEKDKKTEGMTKEGENMMGAEKTVQEQSKQEEEQGKDKSTKGSQRETNTKMQEETSKGEDNSSNGSKTMRAFDIIREKIAKSKGLKKEGVTGMGKEMIQEEKLKVDENANYEEKAEKGIQIQDNEDKEKQQKEEGKDSSKGEEKKSIEQTSIEEGCSSEKKMAKELDKTQVTTETTNILRTANEDQTIVGETHQEITQKTTDIAIKTKSSSGNVITIEKDVQMVEDSRSKSENQATENMEVSNKEKSEGETTLINEIVQNVPCSSLEEDSDSHPSRVLSCASLGAESTSGKASTSENKDNECMDNTTTRSAPNTSEEKPSTQSSGDDGKEKPVSNHDINESSASSGTENTCSSVKASTSENKNFSTSNITNDRSETESCEVDSKEKTVPSQAKNVSSACSGTEYISCSSEESSTSEKRGEEGTISKHDTTSVCDSTSDKSDTKDCGVDNKEKTVSDRDANDSEASTSEDKVYDGTISKDYTNPACASTNDKSSTKSGDIDNKEKTVSDHAKKAHQETEEKRKKRKNADLEIVEETPLVLTRRMRKQSGTPAKRLRSSKP